MQDFNEYAKNQTENTPNGNNLFSLVSSIASKFDGKNQTELLKAIYDEAKKGKQNGTLTNAEIDNFASVIAPALDDKQKKLLSKVVAELKKI